MATLPPSWQHFKKCESLQIQKHKTRIIVNEVKRLSKFMEKNKLKCDHFQVNKNQWKVRWTYTEPSVYSKWAVRWPGRFQDSEYRNKNKDNTGTLRWVWMKKGITQTRPAFAQVLKMGPQSLVNSDVYLLFLWLSINISALEERKRTWVQGHKLLWYFINCSIAFMQIYSSPRHSAQSKEDFSLWPWAEP